MVVALYEEALSVFFYEVAVTFPSKYLIALVLALVLALGSRGSIAKGRLGRRRSRYIFCGVGGGFRARFDLANPLRYCLNQSLLGFADATLPLYILGRLLPLIIVAVANGLLLLNVTARHFLMRAELLALALVLSSANLFG